MKTTFKPRVEILEDRKVMAGVVIEESTFDPQAFGRNISEGLDSNIVGYAYAINHNGSAVVAEGTGGLYGPNEGRARTIMDEPETVFETDTRIEIASVSKIITTVAVLHLLESQGGDLDAALSTPISEFLPSHWTIGPNVELITIRHLLTHTSGFYEGGPGDAQNAIGVNFEGFGNNTLQNLRDLVAAGLGAPDITLPDGSPGYSRGYSNANFSFIAKMIPYMLSNDNGESLDEFSLSFPDFADTLFGLSYSQYVRDNVLTPSGVDNASMAPTGDNPALGYVFATAESVAGSPQRDQTDVGGAFGWKLSAPELARFMQTVRYTDILLSDTARSLMNDDNFLIGWSPSSVSGSNPQELKPLQDAFGTYYEHSGAGNGFRSQIVMFPGEVDAALTMNSFPPGIPDRFAYMRTAYANAWSALVIEGDNYNNDFIVRQNVDDPTRIDIVAVDGVSEVIIASPSSDLLTSLEFRGLGGNDRFFIEDLPEIANLILNGGEGDDTFEIGNPLGNSVFDYIYGSMTVIGGTGTDRLEVKDSNGISEGYAISGVVNPELAADGIIDATNYTDGKLFLYHAIEELQLEANTDPNQIKINGITTGMSVNVYGGANDDRFLVTDIASGVNLGLYGEGGADTFDIWNIGSNTNIVVVGDPPMLPGSDDVLYLGRGNLGSVEGKVFFGGADGDDSIVLDDSAAPLSRSFRFEHNVITASSGFGELRMTSPVEYVRLDAGGKGDDIILGSLSVLSTIELFGHDGSDQFHIASDSRNVDPVAGEVIIHGGDGYDPQHKPIVPEFKDDDQLYVYDDLNSVAGEFALDQGSDHLHGQLNKFGLSRSIVTLNVSYDQIERTELHTDDGGNRISVMAAPWFNQVSVYAGGGEDQIDIESTPMFAATMKVFGEAGADSLRVVPTAQNLGNLRSPLSVDGGNELATERDALSVYDSLSGTNQPYALDGISLSRNGTAGLTYALIEDLLVSLSSADNVFHVAASAPGTSTVILGNAGDDSILASNLASSVTFNGGSGDDSANLAGTAANDKFTVMGKTITLGAGSLTTTVENRQIDGQLGANELTLQGIEGVDEHFQLWPTTASNSGRANLNLFNAIAYTNVVGIAVEGNAADNDRLHVNGQTTNVIFGGAHVDRFAIDLSADGSLIDPVLVLSNLQGQNLLRLTDYRDVGQPKINGLFGMDTFELITSAGRPSVSIDGGQGSDVLTGQNIVNNYVITGANTGAVGDVGSLVEFSALENIIGSAGADRVAFQTGGSLSGKVNGGAGTNSLNYSNYVGDIVVNLLLGSATGVAGGVSNIHNIVGSQGNSLLVGDANTNVLVGGTGRNLLIGGAGADQLTGGGGDNIIIGGTTQWDNNAAALQAILQEFLQTYNANNPVNDFNIRVNNIRNGLGTLNGTPWYVDRQKGNSPATAFSDAAVDQLFGGSDKNWFVTDAFDVINNGLGIKLHDRRTNL